MNLRDRLRTAAQRLSRPIDLVRALTDPRDELTMLADRYGSDKGTISTGHRYTRIYSELFRPLRDRPIRLLELGLLGYGRRWDDDSLRDSGLARGHDAPSLRMWADYFTDAEVFGVDFNDFSAVQIEGCTILRGDVSRQDDLQRLLGMIGGNLDIVIDDASHASHHQQAALGALFPALKPGGLYIVEDLAFQPEDRELPHALKTVDLLRRAELTRKFISPHMDRKTAGYLDAHVAKVALYDSVSPASPLTERDSLGILWKKH